MASDYGRLLGWGLAIGGVAGLLALLRGRPAQAAAAPPRQRFHPGDEVSRPGGKTGDVTTVTVTRAELTPDGWRYGLSDGTAAGPGDKLFLVEPAAPAKPLAAAAPAPTYEFPTEVVTHSPAFLAAEAARKASTAAADRGKIAAAAPAAPTQGGATMTTRQARIIELQKLIAGEKDAARKAQLADELRRLAGEELAELKAKPASPQPTYPVGLEARFGKRTARILSAEPDGRGSWRYTAWVESGELFGIGSQQVAAGEREMVAFIAKEIGQAAPAPGQAYLAGLAVYRNGQGGLVQRVAPGGAGGFTYTIQGWPNPVSQDELAAILRRA